MCNNSKDDLKKEIDLIEVKMTRPCEILDKVSCYFLLGSLAQGHAMPVVVRMLLKL
jgi:hypothetical protein